MKEKTSEGRFTSNEASPYVSYCRVSTRRQGQSGLGLEAQQRTIENYLTGEKGHLLAEYVEVESGRKVKRPQLQKALALARQKKATLVIAKLDRLARNVHFITGLMASRVDFVACDIPAANKLTIGILACVAEDEADRISQRTRAALAAAKARGVKLGVSAQRLAKKNKKEAKRRARELQPHIEDLQNRGIRSYGKMAEELNQRGILTPQKKKWHPTTVMRLVKRLELQEQSRKV